MLRTAALCLTLVLGAGATAEPEECQCLWRGPFTDVQAGTDLVISGTVSQVLGNSVDLEIDEVLRGSHPLPALRVWMKTAHYCRPEVERFPVGSHWVLALNRIDEQIPGGFNPGTPNISYGRVGDYLLSSCGGYFLSRTGDLVSGNLAEGPRWDYEPKMNPVLFDLVADFVAGRIGGEALLEAGQEDPAVRNMMLDTKAFLRGDEAYSE